MKSHDDGPITAALRRQITASERTPCSIAREAGVDTATIYRFLSGERQLKSSSLERLCQVLDLQLVAKPRKQTKRAG